MNRLLPLLALFLALPALAEDAPPPGAPADKPAAGDHGEGERGPKPRREPDPKEMAARMTEHLTNALKLNDEQAKKVQAIVERDAAKKIELQKRLQAMERRTHEDVRAVLDDEQKEKWDMMRAHQMMGGMHGGMHGMHGMHGGVGGPGEGMRGEQGGGGRPGEMGGPEGNRPPGPPPAREGGGDGGD